MAFANLGFRYEKTKGTRENHKAAQHDFEQHSIIPTSDEIEQGAPKTKRRPRPRAGSVLAAAGDWRAALNIRRWDIRRVRQPSGAPALSVHGVV